MAQRNKLSGKHARVFAAPFFWRQFAWATVLPVHLLLLAQANKAEQKEAVRLYCIRVYVILN